MWGIRGRKVDGDESHYVLNAVMWSSEQRLSLNDN